MLYLATWATLFNNGAIGPGQCTGDLPDPYCPCICIAPSANITVPLSMYFESSHVINPPKTIKGIDSYIYTTFANGYSYFFAKKREISYAGQTMVLTVSGAKNVTGYVTTPDGIYPLVNQQASFPRPSAPITLTMSGEGVAVISYEIIFDESTPTISPTTEPTTSPVIDTEPIPEEPDTPNDSPHASTQLLDNWLTPFGLAFFILFIVALLLIVFLSLIVAAISKKSGIRVRSVIPEILGGKATSSAQSVRRADLSPTNLEVVPPIPTKKYRRPHKDDDAVSIHSEDAPSPRQDVYGYSRRIIEKQQQQQQQPPPVEDDEDDDDSYDYELSDMRYSESSSVDEPLRPQL
jgi:hypothetical protein